MVRTIAPLIERMTLIWHGWFATSNQGVASQRLMLDQNELFRRSALGLFADLLTVVTQNPAMLVWLNGNQNVKNRPNENYSSTRRRRSSRATTTTSVSRSSPASTASGAASRTTAGSACRPC